MAHMQNCWQVRRYEMTGSMAHIIVTEWHKLSIVAVAKVKLSPS